MNIINKKIELSDGRVIEIETGKLAKQADGSVVVKMGGTGGFQAGVIMAQGG